MDDVGTAVLEGILRTGIYNPRLGDKIRNALAKYVGTQTLFGVTLHVEELRKEGPRITQDLLSFLSGTLAQVRDDGVQGIFLVLVLLCYVELRVLTGNLVPQQGQ
jgi:hypothetical protein